MIFADATTLMRQAPMTAEVYLIKAIEAIDQQFTIGYAENHPELVAAFMQVSGQDFTTAIMAQTIEEATEKFLMGINEATETLVVGINEALQEINNDRI